MSWQCWCYGDETKGILDYTHGRTYVIWPVTTHPFRNGAPFLLLIETPPTFQRSWVGGRVVVGTRLGETRGAEGGLVAGGGGGDDWSGGW